MKGRRLIASAIVAGALVLAGCASAVPGTTPDAPASVTPSAPPEPSSVATPSTTPEPSGAPGGDISLPAACEQAWSPEGLAVLTDDLGALNDPGFTMLSTEDASLLEVLDAAPTLRCTWGLPSEVGIATNVSIVDATRSEAVRSTLDARGFSCEERELVVRCELREEIPGGEDGPGAQVIETHVLGGNGWAVSRALNVDLEPDYTDDLIATVWG